MVRPCATAASDCSKQENLHGVSDGLTRTPIFAKVTPARSPTESPHKQGSTPIKSPQGDLQARRSGTCLRNRLKSIQDYQLGDRSIWRIRDVGPTFLIRKHHPTGLTRTREGSLRFCLQAAWFDSKIRHREAANLRVLTSIAHRRASAYQAEGWDVKLPAFN